MSRRVVITGLGTVSAFGVGAEPTWQAILEGRSAINVIRRFNPCGFTCKMAAEVDAAELNIRKIVPKSYRKATKVMCRDIELAVVAAAAAVNDAGLVTRAVDPDSEPTIAPTRVGRQSPGKLLAKKRHRVQLRLRPAGQAAVGGPALDDPDRLADGEPAARLAAGDRVARPLAVMNDRHMARQHVGQILQQPKGREVLHRRVDPGQWDCVEANPTSSA